ncbi:MAG TPA: hypothetical protein ENI32_05935 [Candidatus Syntrophoarchaeum butanivorans]|nr:hypothetical protein [Candidatus Syntrophoarchaeum butanivorans]
MVEVDWYDLADTDFHSGGRETTQTTAGAAVGGAKVMPEERIGIMVCDEERFNDFFDVLSLKIRGMPGVEMMYLDFRGCSTSEDYQERIVEGILKFMRGEAYDFEGGRYWTEEEKKARYATLEFLKDKLGEDIEGETTAEKATNALTILGDISDQLKKNLILVMDLRNIKLDPSALRPGQKLWWVYNLTTKAEGSQRMWLIDCDEDIFDTLSEHGQMGKVFSEEGTDLFMIV